MILIFLITFFCVLQILYNEHEILSSLGGKREMFIKCFEQRKLRNLLKDRGGKRPAQVLAWGLSGAEDPSLLQEAVRGGQL